MKKLFFNIFIWFCFLYLFNISFIWLNSYTVKCLHNAYETAYYFQLTLVVRLFYGSFACVLPSFRYHFNSLFLTFITGVCSEIPFSIVSRFVETSSFNFIEVQLTGCRMMRHLGVENLGTDYYQFCIFPFFCLLVICFCMAPSWVFFENVSRKLFR